MKNKQNLLFLIGLISTFSILFSCGNEEDETPQQKKIVGTWNFGSLDYDATINGQDYITFLVENFGVTEFQAEQYAALFLQTEDLVPSSITFKEDGTYILQDESLEETGTYSFQNNESQLTLNPDEGDPLVFEVVEFTNNTLTMDASEEEMVDLNEDGVEETIVVSFRVNFTK